MKRKVPRVNIAREVADVRSKNQESAPAAPEKIEFREELFQERPNPIPSRSRPGVKIGVRFGIGLLAVGAVVFATGFYYLEYRLPQEIQGNLARLEEAAPSLGLPGFGTDARELPEFGWTNLGEVWGIIQDVGEISESFSAAALEAESLSVSWPEMVLRRRGEELIASLKKIRDGIGSTYEASERLEKRGGLSFSPWGSDFLPVQLNLLSAKNFLDNFVAWLDSETPRRILVLLQNPSELRPGGGFIGSYAELEFQRGSLDKMEVNDVNDSDRELGLKIVPPQPLQLIAKSWRAADANWFFDFSDSAKKVLELVQTSARYERQNVRFDGVIGVSAKTIGEFLEIAGPVELKDGDLTLDSKNFLIELQKEVQAGRAEGSDYPKDVLRELAPALAAKMLALSPAGRSNFAAQFGKWLENKDIQIYFVEPEIQRFFEEQGFAGRVYAPPSPWAGDYLAVVSANVGGGKSDLYMQGSITLQSQINLDGTLTSHLVLERRHAGNESKYWWYRTPNQSYLQVFLAPDAKLTYASGGSAKKIRPPLNYSALGYQVDPLVSGVEKSGKEETDSPAFWSFSESGKKVFATWAKTEPGKTSKIVLDYSRRLPFAPGEGEKYEFVFEKQSGAAGKYSFQINAPVGFRFRENGLPVYEYESADPPGRLILSLTLEKI